MKKVVNYSTGSHETGIYSATYDPPQRIPSSWIKPVPKFLQGNKSVRGMYGVKVSCTNVEALGG